MSRHEHYSAHWVVILIAVIGCIWGTLPAVAQTSPYAKVYTDLPDGFLTWLNPIASTGIASADGEAGNIRFGTNAGDPNSFADDQIDYVKAGHAMLFVDGMGNDAETEIGVDGLMESPPQVDIRNHSGGYTWRTTEDNYRLTVVYKQKLIHNVLRWEYRITNETPSTLRVGFRQWLDVDWVRNQYNGTAWVQDIHDAGPYYTPGNSATDITQEWVDSAVPSEWFIREPIPFDGNTRPTLRFRVSLDGTTVTRPTRLVYATVDEVTNTGWPEILDAALPENQNEEPLLDIGASTIAQDSGALCMYYPIIGLRYKETRIIKGEMRLDWLKTTISEPYALALDAPEYISYRTGDDPSTTEIESSYFDPSTFTLKAYLINSSFMLEPTATVTIDLGKGLTLSPASQPQGTKKLYSIIENSAQWTIKPDGTASGLIPIKVTATLLPGGSLTSTIYVNVPALTSVPSVRLQRASQFMGFPFGFTNPNAMTALSAVANAIGSDFSVAWYNTLAKGYVYAQPSDLYENITLESGRAYWLHVPTNAPVIRSAVPLTGATTLDQTRTIWVKLDRGWNAISNPYQFSIIWAFCHVVYNNTEYDIAGAVKAGIIRREMWAWDTANQQYYYKQPTGSYDPPTNPYPIDQSMGELKTLEGYWLYATEPSYLVFAPNPFLAPMGGDPGYEDLWIAPGTTGSRAAADANSWRVNLVVETTEAKDRSAVFGVGAGETDGASSGDLMAPPMSPNGLTAYFPRENWGRAAGRYAVDLQAPGTEKSWTVEVNCAQANQQVIIRWPDLTRTPARMPLLLIDELTGKQVAMRTAPNYTYNSGDGGVRRFRIVTGTAIQRLQILSTQVLKSKAGAGATILCGLSIPADVTIRIRTTGGRLVRTLGPQQVSGTGTVQWDGRDDAGRLLSAGVYVGEVYAEGQDGQRIRAIVTIVTRN